MSQSKLAIRIYNFYLKMYLCGSLVGYMQYLYVNYNNNQKINPTPDSDKIQAHIISIYDRKLQTHTLQVDRMKSMKFSPLLHVDTTTFMDFATLLRVDATKSMDLPHYYMSVQQRVWICRTITSRYNKVYGSAILLHVDKTKSMDLPHYYMSVQQSLWICHTITRR